jgi:hypothetical protein
MRLDFCGSPSGGLALSVCRGVGVGGGAEISLISSGIQSSCAAFRGVGFAPTANPLLATFVSVIKRALAVSDTVRNWSASGPFGPLCLILPSTSKGLRSFQEQIRLPFRRIAVGGFVSSGFV